MKQEDLAYLAGFFDGEGCISFHRKATKNGWRYSLEISVAQINPEPIKMFTEVFGFGYRSRWFNSNQRLQFEWRTFGSNASKVLKLLMPYLKVKREEALLAIEFQELPQKSGKKRVTTDEERNEREILVKQISQLKKREYIN